jgi:hypothetical protein
VIALAACGGHDMAPYQIAAPDGGLARVIATPDASACTIKGQAWRFNGACKAQKLSAKTIVVKLARYRGVVVESALSGSTVTGTAANIVIADATGNKDITGKPPFPLYGPATCYEGATCPGTTVIYVAIYNPNKQSITFNAPPQITVSAAKFPGNSCTIAGLGDGYWLATGASSTPKMGKVTLELSDLVPLPGNTAGIFAIACV